MSGTSQSPAPYSKDELLELIFDSSREFAIFTMDDSGIITSWNPGAERLFGYSQNEILGSSADQIFIPEDRGRGAPEVERRDALKTGRALDERWHQRRDGSRFWASGVLMPLRGPEGHFVKITRDRSEQRRVEDLLRQNEERFRLLATSIPQLVFRTLPDGTRTWGSPQWIEFTGLSLDESLGLGWLDAIHEDDRDATQAAWQAAREKGEYYIEHRVKRVDGEYRWHQTRAKPLGGSNPDEGDWVGTMTDIHDLRGLQDRQQVLMAELQHRTRNLLAVVRSIAVQTIRTSDSLDAFESLFEDRLQALGRVQSLLARVDDEYIDLEKIVSAELDAVSNHVDGKKISVSGPRALLPPMAAQALGLAVHELATNAAKYGALKAPSGKLEVRWIQEMEGSSRHVSLEWTERGVDMPSGGPARKGYGSELIERALPYQLDATTNLEFRPDGVRCTIRVPVKNSSRDRTNA